LNGQIFDGTSKIGIFYICKCRFLTFRQISGHPVIIEGQNYHHSIRLCEMIRMSYRSFFCDHCMLRRIRRINPKSIRMELIRIDLRMIRIHGSRIASLSLRTSAWTLEFLFVGFVSTSKLDFPFLFVGSSSRPWTWIFFFFFFFIGLRLWLRTLALDICLFF